MSPRQARRFCGLYDFSGVNSVTRRSIDLRNARVSGAPRGRRAPALMISPPREQEGWASTLVSSPAAKSFATLRPLLYLGILAWINVYICREAFFTESTGHFNSMHGEWLALARLGDFHFWRASWWPWWGAGA